MYVIKILSTLGMLILLAGLALYVFTGIKRPSEKDKRKKFKIPIVVGLCIVILGSMFAIVPTGYTGVRTTFGQISEQTVSQGINFKIPFVQDIQLVNNKQQDAVVSVQVWGETTEKTPVFASDIIVTYNVNKEKSAWIYSNVTDTDKNLIDQNIVSSAIKSAMVELGVKDVTNRAKIEPLVKEKLVKSVDEKYGENTVVILKVIINNMDFEPSYNEAIAAKSIAQQIYEKQQIENDTAIKKAEADKTVAITNAEAKAEATRIAAQAEADANKLLNASLTENVLRFKFYENWDGKLPSVMGENAVITDIGPLNPAE